MTGFDRRTVMASTGALLGASGLAPFAFAQSARPLAGKSVLVTGTSSGFGRLGAEHYARLGARVFATMRGVPRPQADELRDLAKRDGLDLHVIALDVQSEKQVNAAITEAQRINGGPLDVLVNNAGINIHGPVEVQDMEATHLSFDTNVYGLMRTARGVLPGMRGRKSGLIVNVSSQVGRVVSPNGGIYSATKFAVESMSEQLAYELAPHGVDVAIIQPGGFPTGIGANRARLTAALADRVTDINKQGYPQAVAAMKPASAPSSTPWANAPDPMDVPRAIAEIIAMPAGKRPLRTAVHPGNKPQLEINRVSREAQLAWLGNGPNGAWMKAVHD
ncbi:MAG: SDR family oxidoreductase [Alphaproteobacteria bacterium]|nr:SDR family oxidoreductase [Alphaproteobacteria bacterium]